MSLIIFKRLFNTYVSLAREQNMKYQSEGEQEKKKHGKNL